MGKAFSFFLAGLLALNMMSCKDDHVDQAPEPVIKSAQIELKEGDHLYGLVDTLKLSLQFHDADRDLGQNNFYQSWKATDFLQYGDGKLMAVEEIDTVFSEGYFTRVMNVITVPQGVSGILVTPHTRELPAYNYLPEMDAYPCRTISYRYDSFFVHEQDKNIIPNEDIVKQVRYFGQTYWKFSDTLYYQNNPENYNLFVEPMSVAADNSLTNMQLEENYCVTYNTPLPQMTGLSFGKTIKTGPLKITGFSNADGLIEYSMRGFFHQIFAGKKIRLRIYVRDNANHLSNIIETNDITF